MSDEARLVTLIKKGDSQAFDFIFERYAPGLMSYSESILKDRDAAFEVVQDTFVSVWMNRRRLDEGKSMRNYLLRAVHNNSLRELKREVSRHEREQVMAEDEPEVQPHEVESGRRFELEDLIPAIEELPPQSKKIFNMSFRDQMKNKDIAEALSISVRTVESIIYKVRKRLRAEF